MTKSARGGGVAQVEAAAARLGLETSVRRMSDSTRTAEEAAGACGVGVERIVTSLVFEGAESGRLILLLAPGDRMVDMDAATVALGETVRRADPKRVRAETGFAIGGVAPIGSTSPMPVVIERELLRHDTVWAAAGAPDAVFEISPARLADAASATVADICTPKR